MFTRRVSVLAVLMGVGLAAGCGTALFGGGNKIDYRMSGTPAVPAAEGTVTVRTEKNGNQSVEVKVEHMAPPERAFQGASTYVVWLIPPNGGTPQNMGVLTTGEDLKGTLRVQTPYKTFDILVTAEGSATVTTPSGNRALSANVQLPA